MGTSKHVAILLTAALTGILMAGQDQPTASSQAAPSGPSNTRSASCIVRITADPALLPLNPETVSSLIHSPAVALKALREVLSVNAVEDLTQPNTQQGDVVREPILIRWLNASSVPTSSGARSLQRSDTSGMGGGMGGAMGGMGMSSGVSWVQEHPTELPRVPGEPDAAYRDRVAQMRAAPPAPAPQDQSEVQIRRSPGESDVAYRTRVAQIRSQQKALQDMQSRGMGGGMGGYGAGGMGMGGMGGYGGMGGMGFSYGAPGAPRQDAGAAQGATIEVQVRLPDAVPALADEFLQGVVKNLQDSLSRAHESYVADMERTLAVAKAQHQNVESELEVRAADVAQVRQQLETAVDLSQWNRQMPLEKAVDVLRKSVEPPVNIVVLWNSLKDCLPRVEPSTPINIDGLPRVKLETGVALLVKGLPVSGNMRASWSIRGDMVIIGAGSVLEESQEPGERPRVDTDARNLAGERSELARRIQSLELDLAGIDARREAIVTQVAEIDKLVREKLSDDPVTQELGKLAKLHAQPIRTPDGRIVTPESESAIRARIELATRREELRRQAGGAQLEEFNKELSRMAIDKAEKGAQLQIVRQQFDQVQKQLMQALAFDPEAARLRLARESLDITARRVADLQTRLSNVQPPRVTMIGAN